MNITDIESDGKSSTRRRKLSLFAVWSSVRNLPGGGRSTAVQPHFCDFEPVATSLISDCREQTEAELAIEAGAMAPTIASASVSCHEVPTESSQIGPRFEQKRWKWTDGGVGHRSQAVQHWLSFMARPSRVGGTLCGIVARSQGRQSLAGADRFSSGSRTRPPARPTL